MPFNRLNHIKRHYPAQAAARAAPALSAAASWGALLLMLVTLLYAGQARAQEQRLLGMATLTASSVVMDMAPYTLIQPDPDNKVTTATITENKGRNLTGRLSSGNMVDLGYDGHPIWLTTRLKNLSDAESWVLETGHRSEGRLGYIRYAKAYEMIITPESFALKELKPLDNKGTFEVSIPKGTEKYLLLNVTAAAGKPAVLPYKLYNQAEYLRHVQSSLTPYAIHSFLLLLYAVFFFASALSRRENKLFIFSAFFFYELCIWSITENAGAVIGFSMFGIMIPGMMLGFSLFSIWMAKIFLDIENGSFTERYLLYGLAWLNIIASLLAYLLPVSDGITQISLLYGAPAITMLIICLMAFAQSTEADRSHRYYAIGTLFPVIGHAIVALGFLDALPHHPLLINALWYSVSFQGAFMVIAVYKKLDADIAARSPRSVAIAAAPSEEVYFSKLKEARDKGDHSRLLKVIEKERELLAEFRTRETERVNEMRKAKEEADEANRAKSAFLAVVSHEIRTPMTGVMGMVKLLLDSSITKQQRDYVLTIQESSEAMMALLNDILDFERIQRGKIELEEISFDLHRLIQGVVTLMSGHAAEKGISLSARMDDDLPKFVKGDPTRLRQVMLNLMGNAIKFTQQGGVTLLIKNMDSQDPEKQDNSYLIYFAVQDTGIGISAEAKKNLFMPFAQANSSISRKFGGTGLGLAISKGLIETMGSTVNINSKEGEGSTFFFTLRMQQGLGAGQEKALPAPAANKDEDKGLPLNILVVDDNSITRKVIIGFLETEGAHEITIAGNAEEALQKINRDAFDLVFMDIELPGMKGNEATRLLREHRDPVKSAIPVIAVTGNVAREDMERYLSDGMSGFLPKPIDADKLRSIVREIAHKSFEREIRIPAAPDPFTYSEQEFKEIAARAEELPVDTNVFNPDMLQSLKDTIGGKQLEELLNDLIVKTDEILAAMIAATNDNDLTALAARAHELKGMAGNFGLVEISAIAAQTERKAKTADTADLDTLVASLPDASLRAQNALKDWTAH